MICQGKLIKELPVDELRHAQTKTFKVEFASAEALVGMKKPFPMLLIVTRKTKSS